MLNIKIIKQFQFTIFTQIVKCLVTFLKEMIVLFQSENMLN